MATATRHEAETRSGGGRRWGTAGSPGPSARGSGDRPPSSMAAAASARHVRPAPVLAPLVAFQGHAKWLPPTSSCTSPCETRERRAGLAGAMPPAHGGRRGAVSLRPAPCLSSPPACPRSVGLSPPRPRPGGCPSTRARVGAPCELRCLPRRPTQSRASTPPAIHSPDKVTEHRPRARPAREPRPGPQGRWVKERMEE